MEVKPVQDLAQAQSFLEGVEITARVSPVLERYGRERALPSYEANKPQAVTIGSQIAEFAAAVPAEMRPHISNSFLLAQLAANKELEKTNGGTEAWYKKYLEVLSNVGWVRESQSFSLREISGTGLQVHKQILPVIAAALGPAAAAAAVVTAVLKGLADMNKDSPWITLFDHESQRASANQFQIAHADAGPDGRPTMSLFCFELNAKRSITQVLFFKFDQTKASLRHFSAKLSVNEAVFDGVKGVVENRIADYLAGYVTAIDI